MCSCLLVYSYTCKYFTHKKYSSYKKRNSHEILVLFNVVNIPMLHGSYCTSPSLENHMFFLQANSQLNEGIDPEVFTPNTSNDITKYIKGYNNFCIPSFDFQSNPSPLLHTVYAAYICCSFHFSYCIHLIIHHYCEYYCNILE